MQVVSTITSPDSNLTKQPLSQQEENEEDEEDKEVQDGDALILLAQLLEKLQGTGMARPSPNSPGHLPADTTTPHPRAESPPSPRSPAPSPPAPDNTKKTATPGLVVLWCETKDD
ncbi:unnamed protein product [Arctogadus glacialis]